MDMNYGGGTWEGGGWAGWSGVGGEWDNCNSIINKYIKKKETIPRILLYFELKEFNSASIFLMIQDECGHYVKYF